VAGIPLLGLLPTALLFVKRSQSRRLAGRCGRDHIPTKMAVAPPNGLRDDASRLQRERPYRHCEHRVTFVRFSPVSILGEPSAATPLHMTAFNTVVSSENR
jgi:hypothetical protein